MDYEIDYEGKQMQIIVKSLPIIISEIKAGNPFSPRIKEEQMNLKFFKKQIQNFWNIVTDEDLSMELKSVDVWADLFVDFLMDSYNGKEEEREIKEEILEKVVEDKKPIISGVSNQMDKKETKPSRMKSVLLSSELDPEEDFTGPKWLKDSNEEDDKIRHELLMDILLQDYKPITAGVSNYNGYNRENDRKETNTPEMETFMSSVSSTSSLNTEDNFTESELILQTDLPVQKWISTENIKADIMDATQTITSTENIEADIMVTNQAIVPTENIKADVMVTNQAIVPAENIKADIMVINQAIVPAENIKADIMVTNQTIVPSENIKADIMFTNQTIVPTENIKADIMVTTQTIVPTENIQADIMVTTQTIVPTENIKADIMVTNQTIVPTENIKADIMVTNQTIVPTENIKADIMVTNQTIVPTENIKADIMVTNQTIVPTEDKNLQPTPAADDFVGTKKTIWSLRRIFSYICPCLKAKSKANDF